AVTIEDFVAAMEDASGTSLAHFRAWYHQAGTPEITLDDEYDAEARRYTLTLKQGTPPTPSQPQKQPLVIPVAMGLLDPDGAAAVARLDGEAAPSAESRVLVLEAGEQAFTFDDVARPPVPSLLRGFSAPVKLLGMAPERLRLLARHDPDPFVRWESGQQYATAVLLDAAARFRLGQSVEPDPALIEMAAATLAASEADPSFAAEALILPGESFLADQMTVADPEAIHHVRQAARQAIGRQLAPALRARYEALHQHGPYSIDGASIGRRALRNVCLAYLTAACDAESARLARAQFDARQNMTDVLAALGALSAIDAPERTDALAAFYADWRHDELVLDKWFAIQASSPLPGTIETVHGLLGHPDFDVRTPNRVRAVVGAFAGGNPVRFHDASGAGYRFLADFIIRLDPINGQVAARMVSPLGQWRRFDPTRQAQMRGELARILEQGDLSKGTFEMASKSLG
ncbi:MAG: DUF3458 domain-containing protein, partial [Acetobacteraceae bacterium]|nr:DUF3458 domain-containing protein [Acetobacteraceae bacterium]